MNSISQSKLDGDALLLKLQPHLNDIRGRITANAEMDKLTWFRAGGLAKILFQPADRDDLAAFLKVLPKEIPVLCVGVGSNLLVRDGGFDGVVIRLSAKGFGFADVADKTSIEVGAACLDKRLAKVALDAGIGGFHFYHGIPGSIGGALRMNAGANENETKDRVVKVFGVNRDGVQLEFANADMNYEYRHCGIDKNIIFTHAILEGYEQDKVEIQRLMDEVQEHRESVQPVREKTGGSTFKNPAGTSAWKEIDKVGCRGLVVGGAQMSPLHCNFIINSNGASAYDIETLGETVRSRVLEEVGISLEWEIKRIGNFSGERIVQPFLGKIL